MILKVPVYSNNQHCYMEQVVFDYTELMAQKSSQVRMVYCMGSKLKMEAVLMIQMEVELTTRMEEAALMRRMGRVSMDQIVRGVLIGRRVLRSKK